jgi:hypothetical protein
MGVVTLMSNAPSSPGLHHRILIRGVHRRPASMAPRVGHVRHVRCRIRVEGAKAALDVEVRKIGKLAPQSLRP